MVKAAKLRALAIAAPSRLPSLPDVSTFAEAGLPNFQTNWWTGMVAPAGTLRPILEKLHAALDDALAQRQVQQHGLTLSKETIRALMMSAGLWKPRKQRAAAIHQPRNRRDCLAELIQIDGSDHR